MEDFVTRLENNLGKLKRNLEQMTPEQRGQYKAAIDNIKQVIVNDANTLYIHYVTSGQLFMDDDFMKHDCLTGTEAALYSSEYCGFRDRCFRLLLDTYDTDLFLSALAPLQYRIWYEVYAKWYWLRKIEDYGEDAEPFRYFCPMVNMWWQSEYGCWCPVDEVDGKKQWKKNEFTIMIPPTRELANKAYKDAIEVFIEENSQWRKKLPFLYDDQYKELLPRLHPNKQMQLSMLDDDDADSWI